MGTTTDTTTTSPAVALACATHNGPFHADDVVAFALVRVFLDPNATVTRTRDPERIAAASVVFDVGSLWDPAAGRFDHHQASYTGPLSSAGMVLEYLRDSGRIDATLFAELRDSVVAYVDDIDNGRRPPRLDVPCLGRIIDFCNRGCTTFDEFDAAYLRAVAIAETLVRGVVVGVDEDRVARRLLDAEMAAAAAEGRRVLVIGASIRWKSVYFALGGESHPSDTVLMPSPEGTWHVLAIPPRECSFDQKRPLPEEWAGLSGPDLVAAIGVDGARFCHKNRFIAVFDTREAAVAALTRWNRWP